MQVHNHAGGAGTTTPSHQPPPPFPGAENMSFRTPSLPLCLRVREMQGGWGERRTRHASPSKGECHWRTFEARYEAPSRNEGHPNAVLRVYRFETVLSWRQGTKKS